MESGYFDSHLSTAQERAIALHVRVDLLLTGALDVMVWPYHLTIDEQSKV